MFTEQTNTAEKRVAHPTPLIDSIHFSQAEMKEAMSNLDVHKAKGPDSIGNEVLKNLSESLCKSLYMLFKQTNVTFQMNGKRVKLYRCSKMATSRKLQTIDR